MKRNISLSYCDIYGYHRDFIAGMSISVNSDRISDNDPPLEPDGPLASFFSIAKPYRKKLSPFFTCKTGSTCFMSSFIQKRLDLLSPEADIAACLKSTKAEEFKVELLKFYSGDTTNSVDFYCRLIKNPDVLLPYINTLDISDDVKYGLIYFINLPDNVLKDLSRFIDAYVPAFKCEYPLLLEKAARDIDAIKSCPLSRLNQKLKDTCRAYNNMTETGKFSSLVFTHSLFMPSALLFSAHEEQLRVILGHKYLQTDSPDNSTELALTDIFLPLASAEKFRIINYLSGGKRCCVTAIARDLNIPLPTLSHHLVSMNKTGLLLKISEGKNNIYSLDPAYIDKAKTYICNLKQIF